MEETPALHPLNELPPSQPVPTKPAEPEEWRLAPSSNWPVSPEPQGMPQDPPESREEPVSWEAGGVGGGWKLGRSMWWENVGIASWFRGMGGHVFRAT